MKQLVSPKGELISGILEQLQGSADIDPESFVIESGQVADFDYAGNTDMHWDTQVPVRKLGKRTFHTEDGQDVEEEFLCFIDPENGINHPTPLDETKQYVLVQVDGIEWDLSGDPDAELIDTPPENLEIEFLMDREADEAALDEMVSDKITEQTSFLHKGFTFNRII